MHIVDRRLNPGSKSLENRQRFLRRAKALVQGAVKKSSQDRDIKDVLLRLGSKQPTLPPLALLGRIEIAIASQLIWQSRHWSDRRSITFDPRNVVGTSVLEEERKTSARAQCFSV